MPFRSENYLEGCPGVVSKPGVIDPKEEVEPIETAGGESSSRPESILLTQRYV